MCPMSLIGSRIVRTLLSNSSLIGVSAHFAQFLTFSGFALPAAFIATLAGLAMIPVLQSAFITGFGGKFSLSALVTFLTTVAGVSIYGIGAAFWGLVFGFAVALIVERSDFDGRQLQK